MLAHRGVNKAGDRFEGSRQDFDGRLHAQTFSTAVEAALFHDVVSGLDPNFPQWHDRVSMAEFLREVRVVSIPSSSHSKTSLSFKYQHQSSMALMGHFLIQEEDLSVQDSAERIDLVFRTAEESLQRTPQV